MKTKEFKKLDIDEKLLEMYKELHRIRAIQSDVILPAIEEILIGSEVLAEEKIDEMVEFLKSSGFIVHKRV